MPALRHLLGAALLASACGAGDDDGAAVHDGPPPDAATTPDAPGIDAAVDAPPLPGVNRVFLSSPVYTGDMVTLERADAQCAAEASAAGLAGTFVAWLSTPSVDARDRLAGSRGWVRVDGAPVADTVEAMLGEHRMFNPIDLDASGAPQGWLVWTGTGADGRYDDAGSCDGWTSPVPDAEMGVPTAGVPHFTNGYSWLCESRGSFYCFELGHSQEVRPAPDPTATRHAFVSRRARDGRGVAPLDAICAAEATAAGLPGTYKAAVATTTATIASRFTVDDRAWRRVDGTRIAGPELLAATEHYTSFVNQHADGAYTDAAVIAGAVSPVEVAANGQWTCDDWQAFGPSSTSFYSLGRPQDARQRGFWSSIGFVPCRFNAAIMCLQE